jgi:hypothetical protein
MSIHSRKLTLIEAFIRLNDELLLQKLELLMLSHEQKISRKKTNKLSIEEFNQMIDEAEQNYLNGEVVEHDTLKDNIKTWK